ncbi:MAG: hypothetical protein ACRCXZ_08200 [Patescibacteria group bacterium]
MSKVKSCKNEYLVRYFYKGAIDGVFERIAAVKASSAFNIYHVLEKSHGKGQIDLIELVQIRRA